MKKFTAAFLLFSIMSINFLNVSATSSTSDNETEVTTTEDGKEVYYNNNSVNGSIDTTDFKDVPKFNSMTKYDPNDPNINSNSVSVSHQTQETSYYCGPASGSMITYQLGKGQNQNQMASYFGTTTDGTGFGSYLGSTLQNITGYPFGTTWHTGSDVTTIKNNIKAGINYGNAIMLNTWEYGNYFYLDGHRALSDEVFHYGVISGYSDFGNYVYYIDPGAGYTDPVTGQRWDGFTAGRYYPIYDISMATGGRGYVW